MARRKIGDREALAELHLRLNANGKLSLRQIADMTGVAPSTVLADIRKGYSTDAFDSLESLFDSGPESNAPTPESNASEVTR